tara:strand:- start:4985 stop:5491 length:507 start_codon:yes stop_codon:yes gene_type:complete
MGGDQNIADMIRKLAKGDEEVYSIICEVSSITGDEADLTPVNGDADLLGVKLIAGSSGTPLLITPVIGSVVVATFLSKDTAFISLYSEIESVQIRGDQFGGLIKIEELVKNLDLLTKRVDGIIDAIKNGVPIPQDGGVGLQTTIKAGLALIIQKENFSNMENETIKHG